MVILDTDLVTLLGQKNGDGSRLLQRRLDSRGIEDVATTIVSYEEQMRGWLAYVAKARTVIAEVNAYQKLLLHVEFYREITVIPFTAEAAVQFQRLRKAAPRVGTMDLKIASIALSLHATLITRNLRDFRQIPDLDVQDWSV